MGFHLYNLVSFIIITSLQMCYMLYSHYRISTQLTTDTHIIESQHNLLQIHYRISTQLTSDTL